MITGALDPVVTVLVDAILLHARATAGYRQEHAVKPSRAAAEAVRLSCPFRAVAVRRVDTDFAVDGSQFQKGTLMLLVLSAANLDPSAFESPLEFRPDRPVSRHLSFGLGAHRCLGAALSTAIVSALYQTLWEDGILATVDESSVRPASDPNLNRYTSLSVELS